MSHPPSALPLSAPGYGREQEVQYITARGGGRGLVQEGTKLCLPTREALMGTSLIFECECKLS